VDRSMSYGAWESGTGSGDCGDRVDWRRSGPGKEIVWDWERKLGLLGTSEWVNFFGEKKWRGEER